MAAKVMSRTVVKLDDRHTHRFGKQKIVVLRLNSQVFEY